MPCSSWTQNPVLLQCQVHVQAGGQYSASTGPAAFTKKKVPNKQETAYIINP